jgi:hypothetical protein
MISKVSFVLSALSMITFSSGYNVNHGDISPPTLPTRWVATTNEPGAPGDGVGVEAYKFVDQPTEDNPSALWSNYTGCNRLIRITGYEGTRYLLGCDAVDCCTEDQTGNQVEFQISNIHPAFRKDVKIHHHKETINVFDQTLDTDAWTWYFAIANYTAFTTNSDDNDKVLLHRWEAGVKDAIDATIDFKNFKHIAEDEIEAFDAQFNVPPQCTDRVMSCDDAVRMGKLDPKHLSTKMSRVSNNF